MTYCLLLQLPRDLYNCICSDWLGVKDIVLLDSAVSPSYRNDWNVQLGSKSMFSDEMENDTFFSELCVGGWNWMYMRNVTIKTLSLRKELFDAEGNILINVRTDQVEFCEIYDVYLDISDLVNGCSKLKTLALTLFDESMLDKLNPSIVEQLTTLALDIDGDSPVLSMCRNLTALHLNNQPTCDTFHKIAESNPLLETVQCVVDADLLETIFFNCFKLKNLIVKLESDFPIDLIIKTVHQWEKMTDFKIEIESDDEENFSYHFHEKAKNLEINLGTNTTYSTLLCNVIQGLTDIKIFCFPNDAVKEMLACNRQTLKELRLLSCTLDKETFLSIFSCPNLNQCIIGNMDSQEAMEYVLINIKPQPRLLKSLFIQLSAPTEQMVIQIVETFPTLEEFGVLIFLEQPVMNLEVIKEYLKGVRAKGRILNIYLHDHWPLLINDEASSIS